MKRPKPSRLAPADRTVQRIYKLCAARDFTARSSAVVSAAARRFPRSPQVLLAVAEYRDYRDLLKFNWRPAYHERAFRRVLAIDPCNGRCWGNLAVLLDIARRFAAAARAAQRAIQFANDPDDVAVLARVRAQQGRKAEARRLARKIVRSRSEFARSTAREVIDGLWDQS